MAMFKDEGGKEQLTETIVGSDVTLTGNMKSNGNVQFNGKAKGKIQTESDCLIGETAIIDGSVKAKNLIINGVIKGTVSADEDLEISPTGKVFGDIDTKNLIIKKGSIFIGKSVMPEAEGKPVEEIPEEPVEEKEKSAEEKQGKE